MAGAAIMIISFTMDYRHLMAGGMPLPFNWSVFSAGLLIGMGATLGRRGRPSALIRT